MLNVPVQYYSQDEVLCDLKLRYIFETVTEECLTVFVGTIFKMGIVFKVMDQGTCELSIVNLMLICTAAMPMHYSS